MIPRTRTSRVVSDNMSWFLAIITIFLHTTSSNMSIFLVAITLNFLHVFIFPFHVSSIINDFSG
jgi:hypothetical protein